MPASLADILEQELSKEDEDISDTVQERLSQIAIQMKICNYWEHNLYL